VRPLTDENLSQMTTKTLAEKLEKWKKQIESVTELTLPTDYPRMVPPKVVDSTVTRDIGDLASMSILKLLSTLNNSECTPFHVILAVFLVIVSRHCGEDEITICTSIVNPLLLSISLNEKMTIADVIDLVLRTEKDALEYEVPFGELLPLNPKYKIRFFNGSETDESLLLQTEQTSQCDLTVFVSQTTTLRRLLPIQIKIVYNSLLFSAGRIEFMVDQIQSVLEAASNNPKIPVSQLSLVTQPAKSLLPDPKADLYWADYKGAITDIFSANARLHPDRVCVVESMVMSTPLPVEKTPTVSFTYKQIDEASNQLAHYLVDNGIQREDVVILYSHRGVDLVVAVMGVLKSGATFSVIDPAYPPARQQIYLQVSKPRGLVVLKKAGVLADEVRDYINSELQVKCEVNGLEIAADGKLSAVGDDGVDILTSTASKASQHLNIVLGPDSIGTLSFTSGSTGIPKGVRGRHHSLTHFFPWMSKEFNLTERERFTMLSGIAHDPIQRDIFTPLFLGAQIRIPTADDIGIPGRLAEWMAHNEVTVTHLTPAMGQLLSANATAPMPCLSNAFFVGDVLTKKDVMRLQHLAHNVSVINMYGTTETQRAVSYLKIPPVSVNPAFLSEQKDIMPAGKGMLNVQLLIINNAGLMAGVGEVGEIYVRSGGLAEGYLGLPEVTNEKFVLNPFSDLPIDTESQGIPFYHGKRDRMYRTGDLGRYLPDGNVECTGRADDQVKIRGFRIELKEIDTHMSQHPQIAAAVTLVRRDVFEEKTLVCYFVATETNPNIVKDVRDYLRQKLPSYAVPSVFVALRKMPLTPNGKVDKNALPFPDTALQGATQAGQDPSELNPLQNTIRDVWSRLLQRPSNSISLSDNFFDLGGHSVLATQLVFEVRQATALEVPLNLIYSAPVLETLASEIEKLKVGELNLSAVVAGSNEALNVAQENPISVEFEYYPDVDVVDDPSVASNGRSFDYSSFESSQGPCFFITGVTGFLGAFIIAGVFRKYPNAKLNCLVRSKDEASALNRIIENLKRHLLWKDWWAEKIVAIVGDLGLEKFGIEISLWNELCENVDAIIHNGALVHSN
jgi:L-aminoadipate-semialdehyde dehydrogenase